MQAAVVWKESEVCEFRRWKPVVQSFIALWVVSCVSEYSMCYKVCRDVCMAMKTAPLSFSKYTGNSDGNQLEVGKTLNYSIHTCRWLLRGHM